MMETAKTTALVFVILLGAAMLTAAFRAFGGEELVREFLLGLPGGFWTQFLIVMLVIFILGFFLDFIEIAVVVVPIVAPILLADPTANMTAVWLGVMIGLNIQTSFLTPPFGFALFYLRGVAPAVVKTVQMYKGVIAFITLQLIALTIVGFYPPLVNYLPNRSSFLSDSAPPPRNPRLQFCLDQFVMEKIDADQGAHWLRLRLRNRWMSQACPKCLAKTSPHRPKMPRKRLHPWVISRPQSVPLSGHRRLSPIADHGAQFGKTDPPRTGAPRRSRNCVGPDAGPNNRQGGQTNC